MASRPAFAPALLACLASLSACSSGADPLATSEAANAARSRAKWPLPAEPVADNAANAVEEAANAAAPANETEAAASNSTAAVAGRKLPNDDPAAFRAKGTGPSWSATLVGGTLVLDMPGKASRYFSVTRSASGGTLRLNGDGVQLSATPGDCDDGDYGERVQVSLSDSVLKGCGITGSSIK